MSKAAAHYISRLNNLQIEKKKLEKLLFFLFLLRLVLFIGTIALIYWFIKTNSNIWVGLLSGFSFISFLITVIVNQRVNSQSIQIENRIRVNENEQKYLAYSFKHFYNGVELKGINTELADDFDLFGEGSVFQYINRTITSNGAKRLANKICHWTKDKSAIELQQQAIAELQSKIDLMESFQSLGLEIKESGNEIQNLRDWFESPKVIGKKERILLFLYPLVFVLTTILIALSVVGGGIIIAPIVFAFFILSLYKKQVDSAHSKLGRSAKLFEKYSTLMQLMEKESFDSPYLNTLQKSFHVDGTRASISIKKLFVLLNRFDFRFNLVVNILFNSSLLFELQVLRQLEQWKGKHEPIVNNWFDALWEMDALISFARFAFNNQENVSFPTVQKQPLCLSAKGIGHPIIPIHVRIGNDVDFYGQPKVIVVTGANMAGKSTFLRTIAVNLILAHNGAPVCASEFKFTPCDIVSSINIHDSLSQNESYFYAELLRIRKIIDHIAQSNNTLVILDEILRGTNPKDKQIGSMGLIEKLIQLNSFTLIATHDLAIGQMEETYPNIILNRCFEVELEDEQLVFDYKLKEGISKKLNASFLMRKMGIIN